jgi:hypothetical protein
MATLVCAVGLRVVMWLIVSVGFGRAMERSLLATPDVASVVWEMDTPMVTGSSETLEPRFESGAQHYGRIVDTLEKRYNHIIGWSISAESISALNDAFGVDGDNIYAAGGANAIEADNNIISKSNGSMLLYVKAYEPPTMDFVDFLTSLAGRTDNIIIAPIGTPQEHYQPERNDIEIWERKLAEVDELKVWLWREKVYNHDHF